MNKTLVAYFSATGTTRTIAQMIAEDISESALFEIRPATPYTPADLDWNNPDSRTSIEMKDENSRPGIEAQVSDMNQYKTIFLGFPIWWYSVPHVVLTFLDDYELAGKVIIPFVTSGSSPLGKIPELLEKKYPRAHWEEGRRFPANAGRAEIAGWLSAHLDWKGK